ncbi:4-hydroxy-tetrahydrodipicolinate synthase [Candidatus Cyanaurora vandensis]|uniref:4-hydroxy-tetrahydrodipicolinate synthase n=1 Tax=Candidatus Cyanaurora vandensis TaxID=2714958 RepID=UPI00257E07B3|nr:4-hydroxy-tetrahydrodipicolinate synthase [Candidatus Cyanaurora vandensis]
MPTSPFLGPVLTAMVTPFSSTGGVDYATAEKLAVHLVDQGSDGLVLAGTTGESPTLTWTEEYELFQVVLKAVGGRARLIAGTGSNCTREAIEATQKAARLGLDCSLQVCPYYNKPSQEGLYQHFVQIARASDLPILIYNIPGRTGVGLTAETVARLALEPGILGIKEASGTVDQTMAIRALVSPEFLIYSGDDALTLPLLSLGACGVISVASHLVGPHIQRLIACYRQGDSAEAQRIHYRLYPLFKALFLCTNPSPVKAALACQGWAGMSLRLPLVAALLPVVTEIKNCLAELELLP